MLVVLALLLTYPTIHAFDATFAAVSNLKQSLDVLSEGLPTGLESVAKDQGLLITALEAFNKNHNAIDSEAVAAESGGDDLRYEEGDLFSNDDDANAAGNADGNGSDSSLAIDMHIDVVLLGFPEAATVHAKEEWFEKLARDEQLQARLKGSVQAVPGPITMRNHFHLVRVSPDVTKLMRRRVAHLLQAAKCKRRPTPGSDCEEWPPTTQSEAAPLSINAWEMEEILASLTTVISSSHRDMAAQGLKPAFPVTTIYVFHLDLSAIWSQLGETGPPRSYVYHTGFTEPELTIIAADKTVVARCQAILEEDLTGSGSTRLDLTASAEPQERLNRVASSHLSTLLLKKGEDAESNAEFRSEKGTVRTRDAVLETEEWAREAGDFMELQLTPVAPVQRAWNVLQAQYSGFVKGELSINKEFRIPLAKAILAMHNNIEQGTRDTRDTLCSANTWVSSKSFMWIDTQAVAQAPQILGAEFSIQEVEKRRSEGESGTLGPQKRSLATLVPRLVRSSEWLQLGENENDVDFVAIIQQLVTALKRHYHALQHLLPLKAPGQIAMCPAPVIELFHKDPQENTWTSLDSLFAQTDSHKESGLLTKDSCLIAARQLGLLSVTIASVKETELAINTFHAQQNTTESGTTSNVHVQQARKLLFRTLEAILTSSGVMHGMPHIRAGVVSEQVGEYLSYVCAAVLSATRELVAPPVRLYETSLQSAGRSNGKGSSGSPTFSPSASQLPGREQQSFLDLMFGSAGNERDNAATSSGLLKGSGSGGDARDALAGWSNMFSPLAYPTFISMDIYIV